MNRAARRRPSGAAQSRTSASACAESFLKWEGPVPRVRRVEQPRRDVVREPPRTRGRAPSRRPAPASQRRWRHPRGRRAAPAGSASASSTACSAAGSCRAPSSARRRARDRQVDAPPPGRRRASPPATAPVLYATGEELAAQIRLRAGVSACSRPGRRADPGRWPSTTSDIVEAARAERPALVDRRFHPDGDGRGARGPAGSVGQVRESALRLMDSPRARASRSSSSGTSPRTARSPGPKTLEHLVDAVVSLEGERYAAMRPARRRRTVRVDRGGRRLRDGRRRACVEVADPARAFLVGHGRGARAASSRPPWRAAGRSSSRSRRSSRPTGTARRARRPVASTRTGSRCSSRFSAGEPGSPSAAMTSTPTSPVGCRSASRGSTCRSRWRSPRRCATARSRPARSRSARSGCSGAAAGGRPGARCARLPASGFARAIVPAPSPGAHGRRSTARGPTSRPSRCDRGRAQRARRSWRAVPAMLG